MHYLTPTDVTAIQKAAHALKTIEDRCRRAAHPPTDVLLESIAAQSKAVSYNELVKFVRTRDAQIRTNAELVGLADNASDVLRNLVVSAAASGCDASDQALTHWDVLNWEGPQFSVKGR